MLLIAKNLQFISVLEILFKSMKYFSYMKLFVFGSTGDLVRRKVMKALQELNLDLDIYAIGRRSMDRNEYQDFICSDWCSLSFRDRLNYIHVDFDNMDLEKYLDRDSMNHFYLSLPPGMVSDVLKYISKIKEDGYEVKILSEKPFGKDLDSAFRLKEDILDLNLENEFIISDHYLFKESFLNLPKDFSSVKIVSLEKVGLEGRVSYYDNIGALRDMVQSHFLNLVMKNLDFDIDVDKMKILEYEKGQYDGYVDELGKESLTETFVRVRFVCCGKEFEFMTGKAFSEKINFVEIDSKIYEDSKDNSYIEVFRNFLHGDESMFPTIDEEILAWKIIDRIEKGFDGELMIYEKGVSSFAFWV